MSSHFKEAIAVAFTIFVTLGHSDGFKGLNNQRNFAHVYGKRTVPGPFNKVTDTNFNTGPIFQGDEDLNRLENELKATNNDLTLNSKAKVANIYGRGMLYDEYPESLDNMYEIPEFGTENSLAEKARMSEVPKLSEMVDLRKQLQSLGRVERLNTFSPRERLLLQNLLLGDRNEYEGLLSFLNSYKNSKLKNV